MLCCLILFKKISITNFSLKSNSASLLYKSEPKHNAEKTNKMEYEEIEYLNAIPHVVDVVVGVAHMFGHDRHPVHQTLWRRITGSGCSRRQMGVVTVRMGGSTWSCSRSRRGPCTWWACFGDMRMSRFRRWGPHERCFLYVNQQNTLVIE